MLLGCPVKLELGHKKYGGDEMKKTIWFCLLLIFFIFMLGCGKA